ncbi:MAG: DegT/DnrJ/EryC1/StrS family aminotransferase [Bdellovibrionales bacterium]|nr:DegT/DnrJ/EryC1/StrS family aminotransferase [Bdellovibrionales bacterium]
MTKFSLAADNFGNAEIEAAIAVLRSGRYTMGEKVKEYETAFAKWVGSKHSLMVNSGSSANLLLVEALLRRTQNGASPLKPGDEVIVPALSWPTTVWPLVQLGLVPVFVDSDPETLAINLESAESLLSEKTKGMFLIHVLGRSADMYAVTEFCQAHHLTLIEDCCETLGAGFHGTHVGRFGLGGSFSHFFSHHLTTIEGGMIVTDNDELIDDLRSYRAHGWIRDRSDKETWKNNYPDLDERFFFVSTGYNVRPMELQAAIGLVQIEKLSEFVKKRQQVANEVTGRFQNKTPWLTIIGAECLQETRRNEHSWMNIPILVESSVSKERVMSVFEKNGVETRPIIAGNLTKHPAIQSINYRKGPLPVCDQVLENGFMIGCHPDNLNEESLSCVDAALKELQNL